LISPETLVFLSAMDIEDVPVIPGTAIIPAARDTFLINVRLFSVMIKVNKKAAGIKPAAFA
jgi:hypothetical protein